MFVKLVASQRLAGYTATMLELHVRDGWKDVVGYYEYRVLITVIFLRLWHP